MSSKKRALDVCDIMFDNHFLSFSFNLVHEIVVYHGWQEFFEKEA